MINTTEKGSSGRLYNRIRYLRKLENQKKLLENNNQPIVTQATPQYTMDDLLFLKNVIVTKQNMIEIQQKLEITRQKRDEMVRLDSVDFLENFPFFFACPELVSTKI